MEAKECNELLGLINNIMHEYDYSTAVKICNNLTEWVSCCSKVSVPGLRNIVSNFEGKRTPVPADYDEDVQNGLLYLYNKSAEHGETTLKLVEDSLRAGRSYTIISNLAGSVYTVEQQKTLLPYAGNAEWSDKWIDEMHLMLDRIYKHKMFGYDLLSVFTPQHFPSAFHQVCQHLIDEEQYRISLDWLKDSNWRSYHTHTLVYLYMFKPGVDWAKDYIHPWTCSFATSEIISGIHDETLDVKAIVEKWNNVSPLLEYALERLFDAKYATVSYKQYDDLRDQHECDGDELAYEIVRKDDIPDGVMYHNAYYHNHVDGPSSDGSNDSILRSMAGDKYEEVKRLLPDCWADFDEHTLKHTIANTLSMLS